MNLETTGTLHAITKGGDFVTLGTAAAGIVKPGLGTYNIGFNGYDETQFDAYDIAELLDMWIEFCAENNYKTNSVDYVERV